MTRAADDAAAIAKRMKEIAADVASAGSKGSDTPPPDLPHHLADDADAIRARLKELQAERDQAKDLDRASGIWIDLHGAARGLKRDKDESDYEFKQRIRRVTWASGDGPFHCFWSGGRAASRSGSA
jgi:hypothetical protein